MPRKTWNNEAITDPDINGTFDWAAYEAHPSKPPVRVATTANGTLATAFANGQTVDGVTLATGDRILLKNQSTGSENGIYVVAASGAPTRATDLDTDAKIANGVLVYVREGTANGGKQFKLDTTGTIVLNTTSLSFTEAGGAGAATPTGTGIPHIVDGVQQGAASLIVNADVHASAAIAESKIAFTDDAAAATASRRTLGTGATQAAAGNHSHSAATTSAAGFMSAADKLKLDNATDAATASTLALRDSSGRVKVATPSATTDAANKAYVDGVAIAAAADASTTVKGIAKASVAPASATEPIFVGDNDPRVSDFGAAGGSHSQGLVPDPGATTHTPVYVLREDGWGPSPAVDNLVEMVRGRGLNLIANGYADMLDNYNFSSMTYDGSEARGSGLGSFKKTSVATITSDEMIPVDTSLTYLFSNWLKVLNLVADNNWALAGLAPYDADGNLIQPYHYAYVANTHTTLAADLDVGDTEIVLTDATNWKNSSSDAAYFRHIILWGYENAGGYEYPENTYSRHSTQKHPAYADFDNSDTSVGGAWAGSGISGNTITLAEPWPAVMGNFPAGTKVSNNASGSQYLYTATPSGRVAVPSDWTQYSGTIGGVGDDGVIHTDKFPPGTAFVKPVFILNTVENDGDTVTAGNITAVADISLTVEASGGSVSDGDKGDITVSGTGATWTIDDEAVTYAKMQHVSAASKLLGRGEGSGAGDVQEITLGSGLSMSGTTLSASGGGGSFDERDAWLFI